MKLTQRVRKAITKAAWAHRGQTRKDGKTPFIVHPFRVATIVSNYSDDEDVIVAALLHDVLEDAPDEYSASQIEADFGAKVLDYIKGVSEDTSAKDWRER